MRKESARSYKGTLNPTLSRWQASDWFCPGKGEKEKEMIKSSCINRLVVRIILLTFMLNKFQQLLPHRKKAPNLK